MLDTRRKNDGRRLMLTNMTSVDFFRIFHSFAQSASIFTMLCINITFGSRINYYNKKGKYK